MVKKKIVGVIGGHNCSKEVEQLAQNLGKNLAKVAEHLVCGGLSGTMKAVCQGFKEAGGTTIGIIPGYNKDSANSYVDIVIPTGLGLARNVLVVKTSDVVVALPGEAGTLSEIAYALQFGIPLISLGSWDISGVIKVETVEEAISQVNKQLKKEYARKINT
ncbi:MAG: TIGR00725 family protein [Candidatus Omnitrophica bacterium]|nr:TIGR00725 family protein [Candidatus Omnitrophota bacterium]